MKPEKAGMLHTGSAKVLNAPVHLATMAANLENNIEEIKSIWVMSRDDGLVSYILFYVCTNRYSTHNFVLILSFASLS